MFDAVISGLGTAPLFAGIALAVLVGWGAFRAFLWSFMYLRATPLQRERIKLALRVRMGWRRLAPNVGLARVDENSRGVKGVDGKVVKPVVNIPKIKVLAEPWGVRVLVKTIPKVGVEEFEKASGWLADEWSCERLEVNRLKAGTLEVRGVVGDPLAEHFDYELPKSDVWEFPIGRNPWGRSLSIPLKELAGIKISGVAGYGKTMLLNAWMASLADRENVQFAVFDGKVSDARYGDWGQLGSRAMFVVGDNPEEAGRRLTELVRLVKDRPQALVEERGTHKFWKGGPTKANPLVVVFVDECHNYSDSSGLKGKEKEVIEKNARHLRTIAKEARGVGVILIAATQKQTGDAIPTGVRDNLEVGISFAVSTLDAAEATLGSGIRRDRDHQPVDLLDKETCVGICIARGIPGLGGRYSKVRVGDVNEEEMVERTRAYAGLVRNVIPEEATAQLRDASAGMSGGPVPMQKISESTRRKAS